VITLKIKNDPEIMEATPIVIHDGMKPHRLVLRFLEDSYQPYATHMEDMRLEEHDTWVHEAYYHGHYYGSLELAKSDFEDRRRSV
jgi:hypothetical protein